MLLSSGFPGDVAAWGGVPWVRVRRVWGWCALEFRRLDVANREVLDTGVHVQQDVEVCRVHADERAEVECFLAAAVTERAQAERRRGVVDHVRRCWEAWGSEGPGDARAGAGGEASCGAGTRGVRLGAGGRH